MTPEERQAFDELSRRVDVSTAASAAALNRLTAAEHVGAALVAAGSEPRPAMVRDLEVPGRHQPRRPVSAATGVAFRNPRAPGAPFDGIDQVLESLMAEAQHRGAAPGHVTMAQLDWRDGYEPERRLKGSDPDALPALVASAAASERETLIATGGVPGPAQAQYQIPLVGSQERPLRDAMTAVLADRGQLIYNRAPSLTSVVVNTSGAAVNVHTNAADIAGTAKTIQTIGSPTATTTTVRALPIRWKFGNFATRFNPEWVRSWFNLGLTAHARLGEELLLQDLTSLRTLHMTDAVPKLGAFRDLKRAYLAIVDELRDRNRDFVSPIRFAMPAWVVSLLIADVVAQQPGDNALEITPAQMRATVAGWAENVTPVWMLDSATGRTMSTPGGQSPILPAWTDQVDAFAWISGSVAYLDGGMLDVGVVRDAALSQTNDAESFAESWETCALVGADLYHATLSLCPNGVSQAAAVVAGLCTPSGS